MSNSLIDRSPDLKRLRDEGYDIEVTHTGHLLMKGVPYVTEQKAVKRGTLVSDLDLVLRPDGDVTAKPERHVVRFIGDTPCDQNGSSLGDALIIGSSRMDLGGGLLVDFEFSRKPNDGYRDYFHKMTTYAKYISKFAQRIEKNVTARTHAI